MPRSSKISSARSSATEPRLSRTRRPGKGRYRVALRGMKPGDSYCSCPDFTTNDLGTCKHIEFALAKVLARRGGKTLLAQNLTPPYSEVYLSYRGARCLCFRAGTECPPALAKKGAAQGLAAAAEDAAVPLTRPKAHCSRPVPAEP